MDNVSFKANINLDYFKVKEGMIFDRYFDKTDRKTLKRTLKEVQKLSSSKVKSNVDINPRLDNNQLNLITTVSDKTGNIKTVIPERSARKMVDDENFANRFISNIKQAIVNVDITRKNLKQINHTINKSNTLEDTGFTGRLPYYMLESLKQGTNSTKRIISILKKIDKKYPDEQNKISIKSIKNNKNHSKTTYFVLENSQGEKKIPIQNLLRDPMQKLFA